MQRQVSAVFLSAIFLISCNALIHADTLLDQGQALINSGQYEQAVDVFGQYVDQYPTTVDGYRGRIEALLMLKRYSDALRDYATVTAKVIPVCPEAPQLIFDHYADRLSQTPNSRAALTGASFAAWWDFDYTTSLELLKQLLKKYPNDPYGILFRGSARVLSGVQVPPGLADLRKAIRLDGSNPHVRFIVADAYNYGLADYTAAFDQANVAISLGLDTPRLRAILASYYEYIADEINAANETMIHFLMTVTNFIPVVEKLQPGDTVEYDLLPGMALVIPVEAIAGEQIVIETDSPTGEVWDTILVLLAPAGSPIKSADDVIDYYAAINWTAPQSGTYLLLVTSFESVQTGPLTVTRY